MHFTNSVCIMIIFLGHDFLLQNSQFYNIKSKKDISSWFHLHLLGWIRRGLGWVYKEQSWKHLARRFKFLHYSLHTLYVYVCV